MFLHQVDCHRLKEEWDAFRVLRQKLLPEGLHACPDACLAFKAAIDSRPWMHPAPAVGPVKGNMHDEVERPEALA